MNKLPVLAVVPVMLLAAALLLGGGGARFAAPEIGLELVFAVLAAGWMALALEQPGDGPAIARRVWLAAALIVLLPLFQLVPLPPALWQALPGREPARAAFATLGPQAPWRPWSLTPDATLGSLLAMAPAAAMLVMAAAQNRGGRQALLALIAGAALASLVAGAAQLSSGAMRFYYPDERFLDGFQAGHNAEADLLLAGMVALAGCVAAGRGALGGLAVAGTAFASGLLALGVVLTASRAGMALLAPALAAEVAILAPRLRLPGRRLALLALAAGALGAFGLAIARHDTALARAFARFGNAEELRPAIWRDSALALRSYWPAGAGMGSFTAVYPRAEQLDSIRAGYINRAHDDYLELLIEAGLPGALVLAAFAAMLALAAWRVWSEAGADPQRRGAAAILALIALHAVVDYPLRTMALACMTSSCAGMLLSAPRGGARKVDGSQ
ncbi:MAG: O-antigen ligase family protein [Sphingomonadales bacterium]|nr:O-antigen ligase family protein [Sphingomonadales bacterium]